MLREARRSWPDPVPIVGYRPPPIFAVVRVYFVPGIPGRRLDQLREKLVKHAGQEVHQGIKDGALTHVIASNWSACVDRASWSFYDSCTREKGVLVLDLEWLEDSVKSGQLRDPAEYGLMQSKYATVQMVKEKHTWDMARIIANSEQGGKATVEQVSEEYLNLLPAPKVCQPNKTLFACVIAVIVPEGMKPFRVQRFRREIQSRGGSVMEGLTKDTTHLVCQNYYVACREHGKLKIRDLYRSGMSVVSPDWVRRSLQKEEREEEEDYDLYESWPKIRDDSGKFLGYVTDEWQYSTDELSDSATDSVSEQSLEIR
jgi:BRCA1 C Terminus (BRCT) domain